MPPPNPFRLEFTRKGQASVDDAVNWLESLSIEAAQRFVRAYSEELTRLCERLAEGLRPQPDEAGFLFYSRPVFQYVFYTGQQRRRRTTSGAWRIYYEIRDMDGDGQPDTVRVLAVRHAAARHLSVTDDDEAGSGQ